MGNDMAGILKELGYDEVDVLGYSMGGGVAFQIRRAAPGYGSPPSSGFRRLRAGRVLSRDAAAAGSSGRCDGGVYEGHADVPVVRGDCAESGRVSKLLDQMGALMRKSYDWSADVQKADHAGYACVRRQRHVPARTHCEFYQLLGGGLRDAGWQREHMSQNRLAIFPTSRITRCFSRRSWPIRCCRS